MLKFLSIKIGINQDAATSLILMFILLSFLVVVDLIYSFLNITFRAGVGVRFSLFFLFYLSVYSIFIYLPVGNF